ncbi:AlpA family transcriptional regulator [Yersinia entomophaga]
MSNHQPRLRLTQMLPENSIMTIKPSLLEDQFVDMAFITKLLKMTDKWLYKLIKDGLFPKPIKLGRSSRWLQSEVEIWLQERIAESRQ